MLFRQIQIYLRHHYIIPVIYLPNCFIIGHSYSPDNRVVIDVTELSEEQRAIIQNLIKDMKNYST